MIDVLVIIAVTLWIFLGACYVQNRFQHVLLNPLLLSLIVIVSLLSMLGLSYQDYMQGAQYINFLLEPAVVLLGYPLYKQRYLLYAQWRKILAICFSASFLAVSLIAVLAQILGLKEDLIASMVTMHITTAVSMSTSVELGGVGAIAASMVLIAGVTGSIFGVGWLRLLKLTKLENNNEQTDFSHANQQKIIGMAIGCTSHALGTASIVKSFPIAAAYASTALILCAVITALIAPIYVPLLFNLL